MKKQNFLILLFVLMGTFLQAQMNDVTLYGFKQRSTGGMQKRGDLDEKGTLTRKEPAPIFQYTIYLATHSKLNVYPVQLWINGAAFSVKAMPVATRPVLPAHKDHGAADPKALIPQTAGRVWKLTPMPLAVDKSDVRAKALAAGNDLVVRFKMGGKLRYGVLKMFTELDDRALQ